MGMYVALQQESHKDKCDIIHDEIGSLRIGHPIHDHDLVVLWRYTSMVRKFLHRGGRHVIHEASGKKKLEFLEVSDIPRTFHRSFEVSYLCSLSAIKLV
jgi:hypothetical protein